MSVTAPEPGVAFLGAFRARERNATSLVILIDATPAEERGSEKARRNVLGRGVDPEGR